MSSLSITENQFQFRKNGQNNTAIIDGLRAFIARAYHAGKKVFIDATSRNTWMYSLVKMEHPHDLRVIQSQKYSEDGSPCTCILEIIPSKSVPAQKLEIGRSIWLDEGSDITFVADNKIEIILDHHTVVLSY